MLRYLLIALGIFSEVRGDDPKDISGALSAHVANTAKDVSKLVHIGDLTFGNVIMHNAYLGELTTMRLINKTWLWRKFVWFSVFGDVKLDIMYLTANDFTIDGKNQSGTIAIEDNILHFNWEAVDHFRCTVINERIDWLPLKGFVLQEGKTTKRLNFSDEEVGLLKRKLLSYDFLTQFRNILLPCLHPKYPITYRWENKDHSEW